MVRRLLLVATLFALAVPIWAAAQFWPSRASSYPNVPYDDRWVFTRLRYHPSSSWNHDYPRADRHLAYIVADISKARARTDASNVLDLGDPEIFRHPLVYMSEPGFWDMTDAEAQNLRQYLLKGGLILFDDFETVQWNNMAAQMRRVLPEIGGSTIDVTHPVFHTFFDLKKIDYHHPMFPGMVPEVQGVVRGQRSERPHDCAREPQQRPGGILGVVRQGLLRGRSHQ